MWYLLEVVIAAGASNLAREAAAQGPITRLGLRIGKSMSREAPSAFTNDI
ncbi:hypothetical protein [Bradyrhizobium guangzhouense]|nr:hypothetical protein [Bradyrhizobium guangzhouense]